MFVVTRVACKAVGKRVTQHKATAVTGAKAVAACSRVRLSQTGTVALEQQCLSLRNLTTLMKREEEEKIYKEKEGKLYSLCGQR